MPAILDYKCPNCGGTIKFNSSTQQLQCESCDSIFNEEQLSESNALLESAKKESSYDWHPSGTNDVLTGANSYNCKSCGAQIIADETTAASSCPYCGSTVVLAEQLSGVNKPDFVIPFKLDKKAAQGALKRFYKGKWLLPSIFMKESRLNEIKSIYVPFWLFDGGAQADIIFDAIKTTYRSDSKYDYTEDNHYKAYRSGSLDFLNVPVDGSSKMDDAYMEGLEPYNYAELTPFNPAYLSGYLADKYDIDATASFARANERINSSIVTSLSATVTGYSSVKPLNTCVQTLNGCYKYALLPVWLLTNKFNNKNYLYAINGQTGKVCGELPVDNKKLWALSCAVGAVVLALGQFLVF